VGDESTNERKIDPGYGPELFENSCTCESLVVHVNVIFEPGQKTRGVSRANACCMHCVRAAC